MVFNFAFYPPYNFGSSLTHSIHKGLFKNYWHEFCFVVLCVWKQMKHRRWLLVRRRKVPLDAYLKFLCSQRVSVAPRASLGFLVIYIKSWMNKNYDVQRIWFTICINSTRLQSYFGHHFVTNFSNTFCKAKASIKIK